MTAEEAVMVLQQEGGQGYIAWDESCSIPDVSAGTVTLDGAFSEKELLALLFFLRAKRHQAERKTRRPT